MGWPSTGQVRAKYQTNRWLRSHCAPVPRGRALCHTAVKRAVYVARHKALGSRFAVKVMLHARDEEDSRRFLSEARLASKVNHPNTVYIADFGTLPSGRFYLVMEFLRGSTLAAVLRNGPLPPARACAIAAQIAHGLSAVHKKGIIHRVHWAGCGPALNRPLAWRPENRQKQRGPVLGCLSCAR